MEATTLNPIQQHLLKLFTYDSSEENLKEMRQVLMHHFSEKLDQCLDELWDSSVLNQETLDSLRTTDIHYTIDENLRRVRVLHGQGT